MEDYTFWLWLTLKQKLSRKKLASVLDKFGSPSNVFAATGEELSKVPWLTAKEKDILGNKDLSHAYAIIKRCKEEHIKILTFDSPFYPTLLKTIYDPPYVLYAKYRERIDLNFHVPLAVVGTRKSTDTGNKVAGLLACSLAKEGMTIVSGLAEGIDTAATVGALSAGGTAVAVLGCGVDVCYPESNAPLMNRVIDHGVVLSEYPPGTPPLRTNFPERNRIISGLSLGTLVVEAPKRSGALITARLAAEQNRDVFAVPADIVNSHAKGSNALIRDGAKPVLEAEDILSEYREEYEELLALRGQNRHEPCVVEEKPPVVVTNIELNDAEKQVVSLLSAGEQHIDALTQGGLSTGDLLAALTTLELKGAVKALPGKRYALENCINLDR